MNDAGEALDKMRLMTGMKPVKQAASPRIES